MDITILQAACFHNISGQAKHDKLLESKQTDIDMHWQAAPLHLKGCLADSLPGIKMGIVQTLSLSSTRPSI